MPELGKDDAEKLDKNVRMMLSQGASQEDVDSYVSDFNSKYLKKKVESYPATPSPLKSSASESPSMDGALDSGKGNLDYINGGNFELMNEVSTTPLNLPKPSDEGLLKSASSAAITPTDQKDYDIKNTHIKALDDDGVIRNGLFRGAVGLSSSMLRIPAFVHDLSATVVNNPTQTLLGAPAPGSESEIQQSLGLAPPTMDYVGNDESSPGNAWANQLDQLKNENAAKFQKTYSKDISDYLANDEYTKAFEKLSGYVSEAAPASVALMYGNAAGVSGVGSVAASTAVFGAGTYGDLNEEMKDADPETKVAVAAAFGFAEGLFEQVGVTELGTITKQIFQKQGIKAAEKAAREGFIKTYTPILQKYLGVTAKEVVGELATTFSQNAVDKYSGLHPDKELTEGFGDTFFTALAMGGGGSIGPAAAEVAFTRNAVKRANEIKSQKESLNEDIQSEDVSKEAKDAISAKLKDLNQEEAIIHQSETDKYESLTPEGKTQVDDLMEKSNKATEAALDPSISDETKTILQEEVERIDKEVETVLKEKKNVPPPAEPIKKEDAQAEINDDADELEYLKELEDATGKLTDEEYKRKIELEAKSTPAPPEANTATTTEEKPVVEETPVEPEKDVDEEISDIEKRLKSNKADMFNEKISILDYNKNNDALLDQLTSAKERKVKELEAKKQEPAGDETATDNTETQKPEDQVEVSVENNTSESPQEASAENKSPATEAVEAAPSEAEVQGDKPNKKDNTLNDLVDQEEVDADNVEEDADVIAKMDKDIEALKSMSTEDLAGKKFTAMIERGFRAMNDKKVSRSTYTKFRNAAKQVLQGKVAKNAIDSEEAKMKVSRFMEKVKDSLLGQDFKKLGALSTGVPITPQMVSDMIDIATSIVHRAIDVHGATQVAFDKAFNAIKKHPKYKKIVGAGLISEDDFKKSVHDSFVKTKKEKPTDVEAGITGEERERGTTARVYDSAKFKNSAKFVDAKLDVYDSTSMQKAIDYVNRKLDEIQDEGGIVDLANQLNSEGGDIVFPESLSLVAPVILADRLNTMAESADTQVQADMLNKLAAQTIDTYRKRTTSFAKALGLTAFVNKFMPKSKAGIEARVRSEINSAQDSYLGKEEKDARENLIKDAQEINTPEDAKKFQDAIQSEINRIAEELKGKEWVDEASKQLASLDKLLVDLTDC